MNAQNINISLFDILQEDVLTCNIADAVIAYYTEIASDMKTDEGVTLVELQKYVEGGSMQAEAASYLDDMLESMKRNIIHEIRARTIRLAQVTFDTNPQEKPGTIKGFTTAIVR